MSQIPIIIEKKSKYKTKDFVVSLSNKNSYEWIKNWPNWPEYMHILNIYGPALSGKTHLGKIWKKNADAKTFFKLKDFNSVEKSKKFNFILEDFDNNFLFNEKALFHLLNHIKYTNGYLLILSRDPVSKIDFNLDDLNSRFNSVLKQKIEPPDDYLLKGILKKLFVEKQCLVSDKILDYLVKRINRNYEDINKIASLINEYSLSMKKKVSFSIVRTILEKE